VASGQRVANGQPAAAGGVAPVAPTPQASSGGRRGARRPDAEGLPAGAAAGLLGGLRHRRRRGQRDAVRVPGALRDLLGPAGLHHLAAVEHDHPLREEPDDAEVVGDEQQRELPGVTQVGEQVEHLGLRGQVQGADRLVEHDDLRIAHQRAGDRDPLPLPAGEPRRVAVGGVGGQPDRRQGLQDPRPPPVLGHPEHLERLGERLADGLRRVERGVGVLEHDAEVDGGDPALP
jgi:hypothetical protein